MAEKVTERENLTEKMIAENKARHEREAQEKLQKEVEKKPMGIWVPVAAAAGLWLVAMAVFPATNVFAIALKTAVALALGVMVFGKRNRQIKKRNELLAKIPMPEVPKIYAEETARKINSIKKKFDAKAPRIKNEELRANVLSISETLGQITEEVERDSNDRNKVRKLANHYGTMMDGLLDKYIDLQDKKELTADGENIGTTLERIEAMFKSADAALKSLLDSLFTEEAMTVSADISVLESLMNLETAGQIPMSDAATDELKLPEISLDEIFMKAESQVPGVHEE